MEHSPVWLLQQGSTCIIPADETGKGLHLQGRAHDDEEVTTREVLTDKGGAVIPAEPLHLPQNCIFIRLTDLTEVKKRRGRFSPKKTISG